MGARSGPVIRLQVAFTGRSLAAGGHNSCYVGPVTVLVVPGGRGRNEVLPVNDPAPEAAIFVQVGYVANARIDYRNADVLAEGGRRCAACADRKRGNTRAFHTVVSPGGLHYPVYRHILHRRMRRQSPGCCRCHPRDDLFYIGQVQYACIGHHRRAG